MSDSYSFLMNLRLTETSDPNGAVGAGNGHQKTVLEHPTRQPSRGPKLWIHSSASCCGSHSPREDENSPFRYPGNFAYAENADGRFGHQNESQESPTDYYSGQFAERKSASGPPEVSSFKSTSRSTNGSAALKF